LNLEQRSPAGSPTKFKIRHIVLTVQVSCTAIFVGCRPAVANQPQTQAAESAKAILGTDTQRSGRTFCPDDKAIVSLTYDDALPSQLNNALPALNEYGFKTTFFIGDVSADPAPWKEARAEGHELGSHTLSHPCTAALDWVKPGNASEDFDLKRMASELEAQISMLETLGQNNPFSFAYPCGTTWVGKEHTSFVPLIEEHFIAARGVEGGIVTRLTDAMNVPAYFFEGPTQLFIERIEAAIQINGWVVFGFHGIGGDYLAVSDEDHRTLLKRLSGLTDKAVVLPFGEAAVCMKQRDERKKAPVL
jgi:peptidoglycan/xylan/chitin deacetylase (PgdA/CDA1 family)